MRKFKNFSVHQILRESFHFKANKAAQFSEFLKALQITQNKKRFFIFGPLYLYFVPFVQSSANKVLITWHGNEEKIRCSEKSTK